MYVWCCVSILGLYKLRGMGSDGDEHNNIVLLEEAAFVKETILMQIIVPLLKRRGSVLLTITTLGGVFDPWQRMTESTDDRGRKVFLVKTYSMVCDDCIEKGLPDKCLHKQDMLPHWQSPEEESKVKALMAGSPDDYLREALGVQGTGGFIPAFSRRGLAFLADRSGVERVADRLAQVVRTGNKPNPKGPVSCMVDRLADRSYDYCFIAVDPAAGGALSNYAVISTVFERDGPIVVRRRRCVYMIFIYLRRHMHTTQRTVVLAHPGHYRGLPDLGRIHGFHYPSQMQIVVVAHVEKQGFDHQLGFGSVVGPSDSWIQVAGVCQRMFSEPPSMLCDVGVRLSCDAPSLQCDALGQASQQHSSTDIQQQEAYGRGVWVGNGVCVRWHRFVQIDPVDLATMHLIHQVGQLEHAFDFRPSRSMMRLHQIIKRPQQQGHFGPISF